MLDQSDKMEKLTDGQRDCLRLVAEHRSSKEIARLLSISPHTVDQRLKRAANSLEVTSRFEAARMLVDYERGEIFPSTIYQSLVYQSPDLPPPPLGSETGASPGERNPLGGGMSGSTLHEAQAAYFAPFSQAAPPSLSTVLPGVKFDFENDLPVHWRLVIILAIMIGGVLGFSVLVNIAEGLSRIY